jgi:hypothetical protein
MKKIDFETIAQASERINEVQDAEAEKFSTEFAEQQPAIVSYLMTTYSEELSQEQSEYLFFLGCKVWASISAEYPDLPTITDEHIDKAEEDNEHMLNYLADESEEGLENFAEILLQDYVQNELMEFIIFAISDSEDEEEEEDDDMELDDETRGIFFIALKTVVDCFEKAIP